MQIFSERFEEQKAESSLSTAIECRKKVELPIMDCDTVWYFVSIALPSRRDSRVSS